LNRNSSTSFVDFEELDPLISTARYFGTSHNLIITLNQEKHIEKDGIKVQAIPAWKWFTEP